MAIDFWFLNDVAKAARVFVNLLEHGYHENDIQLIMPDKMYQHILANKFINPKIQASTIYLTDLLGEEEITKVLTELRIPEYNTIECTKTISEGGIILMAFNKKTRSSIFRDDNLILFNNKNIDWGDISNLNSSDQTKSDVTPQYKQINAWVNEREQIPEEPLIVNETYTLNFQVGEEKKFNLLDPEKNKIPQTDIPENGLQSEWSVTSKNVILAKTDEVQKIEESKLGEERVWTAQFSLKIPKAEESEIAKLKITPLGEEAELNVNIFAKNRIYRQFLVKLKVKAPEKKTDELSSAAKITDEVIYTPATALRLNASQEFLSPPGELNIIIFEDFALVSGQVRRGDGVYLNINPKPQPWHVRAPDLKDLISNLRQSAQNFCDNRIINSYLEDVERNDLINRLETAANNFGLLLTDNSDPAHQENWDKNVAVSEHLRRLVTDGYNLYNKIFPSDTDLRQWMDSLEDGWRINLSMTKYSHSANIPNIPWGLLYTAPVPPRGQPIDAKNFFALRFRLEYLAYVDNPTSPALGKNQEVFKANCFYWGKKVDEGADEVEWQRDQWKDLDKQIFIPDSIKDDDPQGSLMTDLQNFLQTPEPNPIRVLYFYCHCRMTEGNYELRFGEYNQPSDLINRYDLCANPMADQPLVFVNACSSAGGSSSAVNLLVDHFLDSRKCRAFIGTEILMPIEIASRFAIIFSRFFYRQITPRPVFAGEAIYQARHFLWQNYRNIGGIFYNYINEYDLLMADETEFRNYRS